MSDINQMLLEVNLFSRQSLLPRDPNYPWLVKSNTSLLDGGSTKIKSKQLPKVFQKTTEYPNSKVPQNKSNSQPPPLHPKPELKVLHQHYSGLPPSQRFPNWKKLRPGDL